MFNCQRLVGFDIFGELARELTELMAAIEPPKSPFYY